MVKLVLVFVPVSDTLAPISVSPVAASYTVPLSVNVFASWAKAIVPKAKHKINKINFLIFVCFLIMQKYISIVGLLSILYQMHINLYKRLNWTNKSLDKKKR